MDDKMICLLAGLILNFSIAVLNEFMPFESDLNTQSVIAEGEKGVFTTMLVWLGFKKSVSDAGVTKVHRRHTSI